MKLNIDDFSYQNKIHSKVRQFGIQKLSDEGFNQYIEKDSYTHTFLLNKHIGKLTNKLIERDRDSIPLYMNTDVKQGSELIA
jgi:hypothetical protein